MSIVELKVPDIGDFSDVPVIEVLVKAGDQVEKEQSLLVLESDKATMEVPSELSGKVIDVKINVGDKVSQGRVIATIEPSSTVSTSKSEPVANQSPTNTPEKPLVAPVAGSYSGQVDHECEVVVLGAGPGGYRPGQFGFIQPAGPPAPGELRHMILPAAGTAAGTGSRRPARVDAAVLAQRRVLPKDDGGPARCHSREAPRCVCRTIHRRPSSRRR